MERSIFFFVQYRCMVIVMEIVYYAREEWVVPVMCTLKRETDLEILHFTIKFGINSK